MAYGTRRFNAAFARTLQISLSFDILTQLSESSILILSSHLRQGIPKGPISVGLPMKF